MRRFVASLVLSLVVVAAPTAQGQVTVVKDVNLRPTASTEHDPIRLLSPSEPLTLLAANPVGGFYHVRTSRGEEGWVWSRNIGFTSSSSHFETLGVTAASPAAEPPAAGGGYATGEYSLTALRRKAKDIGLRHLKGDRPLTKSEIHRMLRKPIYMGEFQWRGERHQGDHEPLVDRDTFDRVQAVFAGRPRARHPKQRHPFMGLITCARCGCLMTAEMKKQKYVYYRCTGFKGACGNMYIRQEQLADLLGDVVQAVQIPPRIATELAAVLREGEAQAEQYRAETVERLETRRRALTGKLDRAYDDYVSGKISDDMWGRKSAQWEAEIRETEGELARASRPAAPSLITAEKTLELASGLYFRYQTQNHVEQRAVLDLLLSNCSFDRGSLSPTYAKPFDLFARSNKSGNWRRECPPNLIPARSRDVELSQQTWANRVSERSGNTH